jgi:hypothetical protein
VWFGLLVLLIIAQVFRDARLGSALQVHFHHDVGSSGGGSIDDHIFHNPDDVYRRISHFLSTAGSFDPVTDKVGSSFERHTYHNMYGMFLLPLASQRSFKMLEIGLGCDMKYGPGASATLWKTLFPNAQLWEAEYDATCVEKSKQNHQLDGIHTLVGDQADPDVLREWIQTSGGNFDAIIDDGGHQNCHIRNSFHKLWPHLRPGGYYFVEDMHVGKQAYYKRKMHGCDGNTFSDIVAEWTEQLIYKEKAGPWTHPLPKDLLFVHCQKEACVFGKRKGIANDAYIDTVKAMDITKANATATKVGL